MTKSSAVHWFPLTKPIPVPPISSQFQESFQCQFQRPAPGGTIHHTLLVDSWENAMENCWIWYIQIDRNGMMKKKTWWIWMYIVYHWWLSASEVDAFLVDQGPARIWPRARLTNHPIHSTSSKSTWICAFMVPDPKAWQPKPPLKKYEKMMALHRRWTLRHPERPWGSVQVLSQVLRVGSGGSGSSWTFLRRPWTAFPATPMTSWDLQSIRWQDISADMSRNLSNLS